MAPSPLKASLGAAEWAMLVLLSLLWGGSFFFVGVAVGAFPPFTIVALRVGIAALALWAVVRALGRPIPGSRQAWSAFAIMGFLNNALPFGLIVWSQTQIASGLAAILNATTPLFAVALAGLVLPDERPTPRKIAGVLAGLTGVAAIVGPGALAGASSGVLAEFACLAAAFAYAVAGIFGRRFKTLGLDPVVTAAGQTTAAFVLLLPLMLAMDRPWRIAPPAPEVWAAVAALAIVSTALAYVLYFRILAAAGATNLLLVTFLIPAAAIVLGWAFLGERLGGPHFAGLALIGLGLALIDGRIGRRRAARSAGGG